MKLKEFCDISAGGTPSRSNNEYWNNGNIPWLKISDLKNKYVNKCEEYITENALNNSSAKLYSKGTILYTIFATIGEVAILDFDATTNQAIAGLKIKDESLQTEYLYYYLKSLKQKMINESRGVAQNNINLSILKELDIEVPSIDKQNIIIESLSKLECLIETKKSQIVSCNNLIKSQFVEMLYLNPSANKLGEFISRYKAERANDIDYPVLSITKEFGIVLQSEKFKKRIASDDTSSYKVVPYGKLVQGIHIDERNFAIQNKVDNGIVSPAYKIWNVDETKCNSEVLAYALRSDYVMNYIRSKFTGSIKRRENINYEDFMATPINLPKLEIQNEFYEKKKLIDKQKFEFENSLKKLEELQASLMQEYFG